MVFVFSVESILLNGIGKCIVNIFLLVNFIGVFGEFLYWVDVDGIIVWVDKFIGGDVVVLVIFNY